MHRHTKYTNTYMCIYTHTCAYTETKAKKNPSFPSTPSHRRRIYSGIYGMDHTL